MSIEQAPRKKGLVFGLLMAALVAVLLAAVVTLSSAQDADDGSPGDDQLGVPAAETADGEGDILEEGFTGPEDTAVIDEIIQGDAQVFAGGGESYDPGERRDPFKSLLGGKDQPELRGPRPEGIPGLLIDEIRLSGIFRTPDGGWVAQVQAAANEKGYLIKSGDQLYDGDVVSVQPDEVVFRQLVRDPTALKPFREVTKRLNP